MLRKRKPYNERNSEALDSSFKCKTDQLQARRAKLEALTDLRRVTLYGSSVEKAWLREKLHSEAQLQIMHKEEQRKHASAEAAEQTRQVEVHRKLLLAQRGQQELRRTEALRRAQEENRIAAESKASFKVHAKVQEDTRDRRTLQMNLQRSNPSPI
jgi:hypothetical protein